MYRLSSRLLPVLAALVLFGTNQARAEFADYSFSWTSTPTPPVVPGTGGGGLVALALAPAGTATGIALGTTNTIAAASITTNLAVGTTDSFLSSYSLTLHITDTAQKASGTVTFTGTIKGTLTPTSSSVESIFTNGTQQQITLGTHHYTVTIKPASLSLPVPGASSPASLSADIRVDPAQVADVPEPSSFALGAAALSLIGLYARRRRARRALVQS